MNPQISITADETSQVHVVVQEIPEIPVVEWIQGAECRPRLVPQNSTTSVEASQVVGSFLHLEDFAARMYNQVHQEQIVETIQQQTIVQEIPELQVVERIQEQIVQTIQQQTIAQEIPELQVVERIQEQIVEIIEVLPQERVQQHTTIQTVHVPVPQIQEQSAVTGLVNSQFLLLLLRLHRSLVRFSLGRVCRTRRNDDHHQR